MIQTNTIDNNGIKTLKIPEDLHARLKIKAIEKRLTLFEYTVDILENALKE